MFRLGDLPGSVPLFPLPGALLLPRAQLPLQLFEPRYLQMLEDALKTSHRLIGMIQPRNGSDDQLHAVGCAGRVTMFSETEDGRYMITLTGISRFRVTGETDSFSPYRKADVDWQGFERDLAGPERDDGFDRAQFLPMLSRYFQTMELSTDWDSLKEAEDEMLLNALCMLCPFEPKERQALLEAMTLTDRRETLIALMEYALRGGNRDEIMQ